MKCMSNIDYLTLSTCRVDVNVGDNVAPFRSVMCHLDDFSSAVASKQRLDTVRNLILCLSFAFVPFMVPSR